MATREQIEFIRNARAGKASAQLILGKYYLSGGAGLQKNLTTALYWLHRAATRHVQEAWMLIGEHVPFEIAARAPDPMRFCEWYERAGDAGITQAGLTWVKLLLTQENGLEGHPKRGKALAALEAAAGAGMAEAQWLLAQELRKASLAARPETAPAGGTKTVDRGALEWATRAAANGVLQAQRALAERAWTMQDRAGFLRWTAPVVAAILGPAHHPGADAALPDKDVALLTRYAQALRETGEADLDEIERCWEAAAAAGDRRAQFSLGLWWANMDENGDRPPAPARNSNYRKAVQWLSLAAGQGLAAAWYVLFRIHTRPNTEPAHYGAADAQHCLERAAELGHVVAQRELGKRRWRDRRDGQDNDVHAAYWLQRAAAQGDAMAQALLDKIADCAAPAPWAIAAQRRLTRDIVGSHPFLAARIELAALFGLSLPEALLLDLNAADCEHCLVVDIRPLRPRSRRRLILIRTGEERLALARIARRFTGIECGAGGPEGNYRQRLYLFEKFFPASGARGKAMRTEETETVKPADPAVIEIQRSDLKSS